MVPPLPPLLPAGEERAGVRWGHPGRTACRQQNVRRPGPIGCCSKRDKWDEWDSRGLSGIKRDKWDTVGQATAAAGTGDHAACGRRPADRPTPLNLFAVTRSLVHRMARSWRRRGRLCTGPWSGESEKEGPTRPPSRRRQPGQDRGQKRGLDQPAPSTSRRKRPPNSSPSGAMPWPMPRLTCHCTGTSQAPSRVAASKSAPTGTRSSASP